MNDKLPPEVAEAIAIMDAENTVNGSWNAVRDHLHRLAEENARLKARFAKAVVIECPAHKPTTEAGWAKVIEWAKGVKWTRGQRVALLKLEDGE